MALDERQQPVLARVRLRDLQEQMGPDASVRFVRTYIAMWETRYARLEAACHGRDAAAAMDVVLSIKTASHMAGAARLSALAAAAQERLGAYDLPSVNAMLGAFREIGRETMQSLRETLQPGGLQL